EEEDADAIDSVLELTGRQARPGVARPLPPREEPRPPSLSEEPRTPPLREEPRPPPAREAPVPPKRRSRLPLLAGALAVAAAAGGFFLWNEHPRTREDPAATQVASVARDSPTAQLEQEPALEGDAGTASAQGTAPAVVATGGPSPSGPGDSVVPASGTVPAAPPAAGNTEAPEAPNTQTPAVTTRLQLLVMPPVEVSLDGKRLGRTPLTVPLAPGPYTLELSNKAKGVRTTRAVTVQPQGTTKQRILLGKGTVRVRAPAGSRIFLNGRKAGPKLSLYEGEHQLVVTSGKARWEKSFRLEPRQRVTFDVAYEKP
ncbi:MAG TPA: PEGA domain-containing protein, partial [Thermoanaerobaculia bacterium]|nr:PEGA domain-containing protein [Thermoanaerobaculia bacterium]